MYETVYEYVRVTGIWFDIITSLVLLLVIVYAIVKQINKVKHKKYSSKTWAVTLLIVLIAILVWWIYKTVSFYQSEYEFSKKINEEKYDSTVEGLGYVKHGEYGSPPRGYSIEIEGEEYYVYTGYSAYQLPYGENYYKLVFSKNNDDFPELVRVDILKE